SSLKEKRIPTHHPTFNSKCEHFLRFYSKDFNARAAQEAGFGTRLIDDVLKESIQASGRTPCTSSGDYEALRRTYKSYWTGPSGRLLGSVEEILEELAA
ncbi:Uncharacterized protein FKW44_001961, partial [Caligus rogercresseyi]